MSSEAILNLVFSIVTALVAVIALIVSVVQIQKANKQSLFDRRLRAYLTIKWMKLLCDQNESIAKQYIEDAKNEPLLSIDLLFVWMTNCSALEEIQPVIHHTLEPDYQRKYLIKMEEIRNMVEEIQLIFPSSYSYSLADFVVYYEEMLVAIYKYKVGVASISEEEKEIGKPFPKNNSFEKNLRAIVVKYVSGTFELSKRIALEGLFDKAKKSIRL